VRIDVITIFPALVRGVLAESLIGRATEAGTLDVRVHDLRDRTTDRHRTVDDESFGGGPGMVLKPEPLFAAVESLDPDRATRGSTSG
jgi:tRNA (guanine37-N1)-methyltransferase